MGSTGSPGRLAGREITLLPAGPPAQAATVDVEDWFHSNFRTAPPMDPARLPHRVEASVDCVLETLAGAGVRATFFVLACVARDHPRLVGRIVAAGHEIGCHGDTHTLVYEQTRAAFTAGVADARRRLADQSGQPVWGFRAPSWSITSRSLWAFDALTAAGFRWDSSVFPAANYLYGIADAPRGPYRVATPHGPIVEVPPPALAVGSRRFGAGGGFYLRVLPLWVHRRLVAEYGRRGAPFVLYLHPRELDPGAWHLRLPLARSERLIHDLGIRRVRGRVARLLALGDWAPLGHVVRERGWV